MSSPGITSLGGPFGKPDYKPLLSTYEAPDGRRLFTNERLQGAIDSALAELQADPDAHFVAVAHHIYENDGTQVENVTTVSAVVRVSTGFSLAVAGYKDWEKGDIGAEAKAVWKPF